MLNVCTGRDRAGLGMHCNCNEIFFAKQNTWWNPGINCSVFKNNPGNLAAIYYIVLN